MLRSSTIAANGTVRRGWQCDLDDRPPEIAWPDLTSDGEARKSALATVMRTGVLLVRGVPTTSGMVVTVANSFAHVRVTNYGELFDVQVEAQPVNLAFTGRAIAPHTDNPYRDPVPGIQLLHCLQSSADGGDNVLIDGFAAAALVRAGGSAGVHHVDNHGSHVQIRGFQHLATRQRTDHRSQRCRRRPRHPVERPLDPTAVGGTAGRR